MGELRMWIATIWCRGSNINSAISVDLWHVARGVEARNLLIERHGLHVGDIGALVVDVIVGLANIEDHEGGVGTCGYVGRGIGSPDASVADVEIGDLGGTVDHVEVVNGGRVCVEVSEVHG